jgi:hypothetical protein
LNRLAYSAFLLFAAGFILTGCMIVRVVPQSPEVGHFLLLASAAAALVGGIRLKAVAQGRGRGRTGWGVAMPGE